MLGDHRTPGVADVGHRHRHHLGGSAAARLGREGLGTGDDDRGLFAHRCGEHAGRAAEYLVGHDDGAVLERHVDRVGQHGNACARREPTGHVAIEIAHREEQHVADLAHVGEGGGRLGGRQRVIGVEVEDLGGSVRPVRGEGLVRCGADVEHARLAAERGGLRQRLQGRRRCLFAGAVRKDHECHLRSPSLAREARRCARGHRPRPRSPRPPVVPGPARRFESAAGW